MAAMAAAAAEAASCYENSKQYCLHTSLRVALSLSLPFAALSRPVFAPATTSNCSRAHIHVQRLRQRRAEEWTVATAELASRLLLLLLLASLAHSQRGSS